MAVQKKGVRKGSKELDPLEQLELERRCAKKDPRIGQLVTAARKGDVGTVRRLLDSGADPNARDPNSDGLETPLWAALYARKAAVIPILTAAGADVNDGWPHTPLGFAAHAGDVELVRALIDAGADVHRANESNETPLLSAVLGEKFGAAEALLRAGANPHYVAKKVRGETITNHSPLEAAAMQENSKMFALLSAYSSDADDKRLAPTMLCSAASAGDLPKLKDLIEQKRVDVNLRDEHGNTALHSAALTGKSKVVRYLLDRGADVNLAAGRKSNRESPLMSAVTAGELDVVRMLVEAGADLSYGFRQVPGEPKLTALDYAKHERLKSIVQYLLEQSGDAKGKRPAASKVRGVTTFDTNDAAVLVAADVADVAGAFAKRIGAATWKKNVLDERVKLTRRCYAIFKVAGTPWSIVMKLNCHDFRRWPSMKDAAALSKTLETRGLFIANSDTAGVTQYVLFDRGAPVELFDYGSAPDDADAESVVSRFKQAYGIDLSSVGEVQVKDNKTFASSRRKVKVAKIKNDLDFVNDFVKRQEAFVPFFVGEWDERDGDGELTIPGLGPDDIERLDYVAAR